MEKSEASKDYQEQFLREKKDEIVIAPKKEITKKVRLKARLRYSKITILSLIPVEVYLDGKLLGKTPLRDLNLKAGKKLFKFKILGDGSIVEKEIKLKRGQSHRLFLDNSVLDLE